MDYSIMWRRFLQWVMDRRPTKVYIVGGSPLFYRAYLFTLFGRVWYLHHFLRSDPDDRGWHDHPMRATAIILAGGYTEERLVGFSKEGCVITRRRLRPGRINKLDECAFHRVVIPEVMISKTDQGWHHGSCMPVYWQPTSWSLFISQYVEDKSWGFMASVSLNGETLEADGQKLFIYEESGPGLDEEPWWLTASKGKEVCGDRA